MKESSRLQPQPTKRTDTNGRVRTIRDQGAHTRAGRGTFSRVLGSQHLQFKRISKETNIRSTGHIAKLYVRLISKSEKA